MNTIKVYAAGPQVFLVDAARWFADMQRMALGLGVELLVPLDPRLVLPADIFQHNLALLRECAAVVASVDPFRGAEPDSGTCWEVGFAYALGKPVVYVLIDDSTTAAKATALFKAKGVDAAVAANGAAADGMLLEQFGFPLNLMLACSGERRSSYYEALSQVVRLVKALEART